MTYKHIHIIINTSIQHHIIIKGSRDSISRIKKLIIQDTHHLFPEEFII